jgi:orotate phosphoribosyltransferase
MSIEELARYLYECIRPNGTIDFEPLRGKTSVTLALMNKVRIYDPDAIASPPELPRKAGYGLAAGISRKLGCPHIVVHRKDDNFFLDPKGEGVLREGMRCVFVDDCIETAGYLVGGAEVVRRIGVELDACVAIFWTREEGLRRARKIGVSVDCLASYSQILDALVESRRISLEKRNRLYSYSQEHKL